MDVTMPQLGETVTEGTITRWLKQVGEHVDADEPLFEVSTDKVDSEVPAPVAGVITEILVPEGETVEVGHAPGGARRRRRRARGPGSAAARAGGEPEPVPAPASRLGRAGSPRRRRRSRYAPSPSPQPEPAAEPRPQPRARAAPPSRPEPHPRPDAEPAAATAGDDRRSPRRSCAGSSPSAASTRRTIRGPVPAAASPARTCSTPRRATGRRPRPRPPRSRPSRRPRPRHPRARPGADARARTGTRPRAGAGAGAGARSGARAGPAARGGRPVGRTRRDHPVRQHPPSHRRAHGAVEGHERARVHVGRGRLRARSSACAPRTRRSGRRARASRSPTCRSSRARSATRCDDFPRVNASVDDDALVVHHDVNLSIAVDLDFEGLVAPVIRAADGKRLRQIAREVHDLAEPRPRQEAGARRRARRHVHDHQPGPVRHLHDAWRSSTSPRSRSSRPTGSRSGRS